MSDTILAALTHRATADSVPLLTFDDRSYTAAELVAGAGQIAAALAAHGVVAGDRVALMHANDPAFVMAYFGIQALRAVVVLVNTQYRALELRHILADSGARVALVDGESALALAPLRSELPALADVLVAETLLGGVQVALPHDAPQPGDIALIGYTSGTTGRAKGAMLTHANLFANSTAVCDAWRWTNTDRLLLTLPLFHIHGLGVGLHGTILSGGRVDLRGSFVAPDALDALATAAITMFFGVPTMYTRLIDEAARRGTPIPPIRLYVSGSAPLSPQTFAEFAQLAGQPILERYGMTETVMNLTNPCDGERRPGTVGMPFPGQEARVVDVRSRQVLGDERDGEIQVRGPHVFAGYWNRPDATAEAFTADRWFSTGDLGRRDAAGYYTITGRARELIISGGFNIYPREVEEALLLHPQVEEAAVLGLPDREFGEHVAAVVVCTMPLTAAQLTAWCRAHLASYKKPRSLFVARSLPRNALGKIQKHLLRAAIEHGELERLD